MASILNATTTNGLVTSADNSGSLQLQTNNGTTAVTIDTSQNVGIGTTSPSDTSLFTRALDLNGTSGAAFYARTNGSSTNYTLYGNFGSDGYINNRAAGNFLFYNSNAERMRIDSSGRLLVGTTAVTTSSGQSGEIYSTGATGFMMTNSTAANYALAVKNEGTSGTRNLINFYEGSAGGTARANVSFDSSANTFIKTSGATDLLLGTNNTERMRITSGGDLLVGTTSTYNSSYRMSLAPASGTGGIVFKNASTSPHYPYTFLNSSGTIVGYIEAANTATTYVTTSDYRLKENIEPMRGALNKVAQLKPVIYTWKTDGSASQGFIAHELQAVVPECVTGEKDAVNEDGSIKPQGVDTSFLVATLTAAIQELKAELDATKAEVQALKGTK